MEKKRIEFIDLAKGICIILVIAHHLVEMSPIYKIASCFHVPVFFCLSGIFFKPSAGVKDFLHKKVNMILLPFVGWYLIAYLVNRVGHMMYSDLAERQADLADVFNHQYFFDIPLWFLLTLFWMNVIMNVVRRLVRDERVTGAVVLALMLVGWYMSRNSVFNFMHVFSAFSCLPFFYLGSLLARTPLMHEQVDRRKVGAVAAVALAVGLAAAYLPRTMPRMSYCYNYLWHDNAWLIYLCTVSLVIGVICLCRVIGCRVPVISMFGRYSLIVLVTHNIMGDIGSKLLYEGYGDVLTLEQRSYINFAAVVLLTVAVIPACRRWLPYISGLRSLPVGDAIDRLRSGAMALMPGR